MIQTLTRNNALKGINDLLENRCNLCEKRVEMNRTHQSRFARIDGYCNKQCPVGAELQTLGKML